MGDANKVLAGIWPIPGGAQFTPRRKGPRREALQAHSHRLYESPGTQPRVPGGLGGTVHAPTPLPSPARAATTATGPRPTQATHAQGGPGPSHEVPEGHCMFFLQAGVVCEWGMQTRFWLGFGQIQGVPSSPPGAKAPGARPCRHTHTDYTRPQAPSRACLGAWGGTVHAPTPLPAPARAPPQQRARVQHKQLMHRGVQGLAMRSLKGTAWFFFAGWGGVWVGDANKILAGIWPNPGGAQFTPRRKGPRREAFADTLTQTIRAPRHPAARAWGPGGTVHAPTPLPSPARAATTARARVQHQTHAQGGPGPSH